MMRLAGALALIAAAATACGAPAAERTDTLPAPAAAADEVRGVVRVAGSPPMDVHVIVTTPGGESVEISGPLREELRRLSGAEVSVRGDPEAPDSPTASGQLRARDYDVVAIDGEPVLSGTIERIQSGWTILRTSDGARVYLASAPPEFELGQRVWVQGPAARIVQSYGVLGVRR